jgi:hypothetical protein
MRKTYWRTCLILLAALTLSGESGAASAFASGDGESTRRSSFGVISGTVLDSRGNPVAGALVKVLRDGLNEVVRETKSGADGSFSARVTPGRYLLRALAEGFTPATFSSVQISSSTELVYRFNLQPAGEGRTTPERRADRNDPKFRIRASQTRRSIFHAGEDEEALTVGEAPGSVEVAGDVATDGDAETSEGVEEIAGGEAADEEHSAGRTRMQGFVETFYASSANPGQGSYGGVNFALATPVNRRLDMIFSGQLGEFERFEATARVRAGARHRLSATVGGALLPLAGQTSKTLGSEKLGQFSVRAVDEWVVRDGIVLVLGLDYSRFTGAGGGADSFSPRLGAAFDVDTRTRLHASFAPGSDTATRVSAVEMFEDGPILFKEDAVQTVALVDGQAVLERSYRLEFGIERILDGASSIEATAFFDTVEGRGVGLLGMPVNAMSETGNAALLSIANQQGGARGLRIVYTRRISQHLKASAGYAFGRGQQLSPEGITTPEQLFHSDFFQTASAQLDASVGSGTNVRTVLRFSPRAAVFAIDPFDGRLAVYDPSLSILVTHELPNFGLPVRAQATLDARNLLDTLTGVEDGESVLSLGALRRTVRGGISVRF